MALHIHHRFTPVPKRPGEYHAFPTLAAVGDTLWLACRSGWRDPSRPHGRGGRVRLFAAAAAEPGLWQEQSLSLTPHREPPCELDAIVSGLGDGRLSLLTREYGGRNDNTPFAGGFEPGGTDRLPRVPMRVSGCHLAAAFGHLHPHPDGGWRVCAYGGLDGRLGLHAVLLASPDGVHDWAVDSIIAAPPHAGHRGCSEATIASWGRAGGLLALVRTQEPPYPLLWVHSDDDGRHWGSPRRSGLLGHAPMLLRRRGGDLLVLYRDRSTWPTAVGIARFAGDGWVSLGHLAQYPGNPYDGGYGDWLELADGRLLAVYYRSDLEESPWVEGVVFTLE